MSRRQKGLVRQIGGSRNSCHFPLPFLRTPNPVAPNFPLQAKQATFRCFLAVSSYGMKGSMRCSSSAPIIFLTPYQFPIHHWSSKLLSTANVVLVWKKRMHTEGLQGSIPLGFGSTQGKNTLVHPGSGVFHVHRPQYGAPFLHVNTRLGGEVGAKFPTGVFCRMFWLPPRPHPRAP